MMVYWRFKWSAPSPWQFGYMTPLRGTLVRMGLWNGDTVRGTIVDTSEIETRPYA